MFRKEGSIWPKINAKSGTSQYEPGRQLGGIDIVDRQHWLIQSLSILVIMKLKFVWWGPWIPYCDATSRDCEVRFVQLRTTDRTGYDI